MSKGGGAPAAPNYQALIPLQEQANIRQAQAGAAINRTNTVTPWGSSTWSRSAAPSLGTSPAQRPGGGGGSARPDTQDVAPPRTAPRGTGQEGPDGWVRAFGGAGTPITRPGGYPDEAPSPAPASTNPNSIETWTQTQQLSPEEQWLYEQQQRIRAGTGDLQEALTQRAAFEYGNDANFAHLLPQFQQQQGGQVQDLAYRGTPFDRNAAEQAYYNRSTRFAEPAMQQEEQRMHERLISQGWNSNDPAYQDQMRQLRETQGQFRADARDRALVGGSQEASNELARVLQAGGQRFQQQQDAGQFGASEQQRQLAQAMAQMQAQERDRARTMEELNAVRSPGQAPGFGQGGGGAGPGTGNIDLMGAAQQQYGSQLGAWNAQQAREQQGWSTAAQLGMLALMFSDPELKENAKRIGDTEGGTPIYAFNYKGDPTRRFGFMADEVPMAARAKTADGTRLVDYEKVT